MANQFMQIGNFGLKYFLMPFVFIVQVNLSVAQDSPLKSISAVQSSATSVVNAAEMVMTLVITGKVNVVRDDITYKVKEVNFIADDGNKYKVILDGRGKQLVRVLKSKIVRVTGELKENGAGKLLAVQHSEIIGSTKPVELTGSRKIKPVAEVKPVSHGVASSNTAQAATIHPATNLNISTGSNHVLNSKMVISTGLAAVVDGKTNIVVVRGTNSVPPVLAK